MGPAYKCCKQVCCATPQNIKVIIHTVTNLIGRTLVQVTVADLVAVRNSILDSMSTTAAAKAVLPVSIEGRITPVSSLPVNFEALAGTDAEVNESLRALLMDTPRMSSKVGFQVVWASSASSGFLQAQQAGSYECRAWSTKA